MTGTSVKDKVRRAVEEMPANASFEDAMERLYILYKVEQGQRQMDAGQGIPHEDVKRRTGATASCMSSRVMRPPHAARQPRFSRHQRREVT